MQDICCRAAWHVNSQHRPVAYATHRGFWRLPRSPCWFETPDRVVCKQAGTWISWNACHTDAASQHDAWSHLADLKHQTELLANKQEDEYAAVHLTLMLQGKPLFASTLSVCCSQQNVCMHMLSIAEVILPRLKADACHIDAAKPAWSILHPQHLL